MAVTSLLHIEGRLKDLIDYVENSEKTVPNGALQDLQVCFLDCLIVCRLRGKVKPCHCQWIHSLSLFTVQADELHTELYAALYTRGSPVSVDIKTASAFPVLFAVV